MKFQLFAHPPLRRAWLAVHSVSWCAMALFVGAVCLGCAKRTTPPGRAAASAELGAETPLPAREQVVVAADQMAFHATSATPTESARALLAAARLRTRLWRLEDKEVDGLEAADLYAKAVRGGENDCTTQLEVALFEGQRRGQLGKTAIALEHLRQEFANQPCADAAALALSALGGYVAGARSDAAVAPAAAPGAPATLPSATLPSVEVPETPQATTISRVEHYGSQKSARIVILMSQPSRFEMGELSSVGGTGHRLYVDILGADFVGPSEYEVGGLVTKVRLGKHDGGVRAVLDLKEPVLRRVFYLPEPFRLVLDVSLGDADVTGKSASIERVVLDPGHGGYDPGAIGPGGLREKDVALDVAHRAAPLIARELGISALLTRDGDAFVPLDERVARANAFGADLFISIHCNSSESDVARGVMTFVLDASPDRVAASIAARENAASEAAGAELASAMSRMLDARAVARSSHFAALLQRAAMASLVTAYPDVPNGGVRRAGFYVLAGARMPAVLFEGSFISNPVDELRLDAPDYRQKLADSIVNAVRAYRDGAEAP